MLGHNRDRDDVSFPDHSESPDIGESKFEPAHYVSNDFPVDLCDDEGLWTALVDFHEEVGAVVFGKADSVDLYYAGEIFGAKWPQKKRRLQQFVSLKDSDE